MRMVCLVQIEPRGKFCKDRLKDHLSFKSPNRHKIMPKESRQKLVSPFSPETIRWGKFAVM